MKLTSRVTHLHVQRIFPRIFYIFICEEKLDLITKHDNVRPTIYRRDHIAHVLN